MKGEKQRTDRDVLQDCWGRWTAILSLFAQNRPARHRLDPGAYAALRNELIAACRSLAEADSPERPFYAGLEETVKPWLNLGVLDRTDREMLSGLMRHCRDVDRQLGGRKRRPALLFHGKRAVAIVAGAVVVGGLLWLLPTSTGHLVLNALRDVVNMIWLTIEYTTDTQRWSAFAAMVVIAAMFIVSRTARA